MSPLLVTVNAQLNEDLGAQFTKVQTTLDGYKTSDGFEPYGRVSEADRAKLKTSMAELSEPPQPGLGVARPPSEPVGRLPSTSGFSRRRLLAGTAVAAAGAAAAVRCSPGATTTRVPRLLARPPAPPRPASHSRASTEPGITTPPPRHAIAAAFDVTAADRDELVSMFRAATTEVRDLMAGEVAPARSKLLPPLDNLIVGVEPPPDDLTVTLAVGASLFDDRYGLTDRKPKQLEPMPAFPNDEPHDDQSHGDSSCRSAPRRPRDATHVLRTCDAGDL